MNLKKLIALQRKVLECETNETKLILSDAIARCILIEKEKSVKADKERRLEYQGSKVQCICGKSYLRKSIYNHKKICTQISKEADPLTP